MKKFIAVFLAAFFLATPAYALSYPVSGRYGLSTETKPGPIDCTGKRVIRFDDVQRFDSGGGVPAYRMIDLMQSGSSDFQITEAFNTAQIKARITYRLRLIDSDRIELAMSPGGILKLKRCA
jgi:hypothetical protein